MNYAIAQAEIRSKYPPAKKIYHKYIFPGGEVRTYHNELKHIGENVQYKGLTAVWADHWQVEPVKVKKTIEKVTPDKGHIPDNFNKPMLWLYLVNSEPRYYQCEKNLTDFDMVGKVVEFQGIKFGIQKSRALSVKNPNPTKTLAEKVELKKLNKQVRAEAKRNPTIKHLLKINIIDNEHQCCYCEVSLTKDNYTKDHIVPIYRGGKNTLDNLRPCCYECNNEKGGLLLRSYIQMLNLLQAEQTPRTDTYVKLQKKIINANNIAKSINS